MTGPARAVTPSGHQIGETSNARMQTVHRQLSFMEISGNVDSYGNTFR